MVRDETDVTIIIIIIAIIITIIIINVFCSTSNWGKEEEEGWGAAWRGKGCHLTP